MSLVVRYTSVITTGYIPYVTLLVTWVKYYSKLHGYKSIKGGAGIGRYIN